MRILCVEDDPIISNYIVKNCNAYGEVTKCNDLNSALKEVNGNIIFDYALIDLNLGNKKVLDGLEVLKACVSKNIKSAMLTGHEEKEVIKQAFQLGASQYFSKVNLSDNINYLLNDFLRPKENHLLLKLFSKNYITKNDPLIKSISFAIEQSRFDDQPILLTGPTGVGKTKVAKLIHDFSDNDGPFISKNLNEINENLIESELFGHVKGAFTGAKTDKMGLLESANGGTLFLDEIASLPLSIQKKLLKVIEEKKFSRVGEQKTIGVDFKLITATCDDIEKNIEKGNLRVDFYFRLKGIEVDIPALAKRPCDITPLIDFIIEKSPKKIMFDDESIDLLNKYSWPGNTRELIDCIKYLIKKCNGLVKIDDLPDNIFMKNNLPKEENGKLLTPSSLSFIKEKGLPELIKLIEKEAFELALSEYGERINKISRELKISKSVYYRLAESKKRDQHG